MKKMNKVVHFEIPYSDSHRAQNFYHQVFGWQVKDAEMEDMEYMEYKMAVTGPTDEENMPSESGFINGGLMPKNDMIQGPVIAMHVEDIKAAMKLVEEHGGQKIMEPMAISDMGFYVYIKDPEGNVIGMWQDKK